FKCLFLTVTHSLKYFYTASSGIENFPSYVSVGLVDDVQISYCDSRTNENIPKQDWMNKVNSEYPDYWKEETETCLAKQQLLKDNLEIAKLRFNKTGGEHIYQQMYGCEWDDETGKVKGYDEFGYDGEDLIRLDPKTQEWIAPKPQAVNTKHKWDHDRNAVDHEKFYLTQTCVEWLQKYVNYGRRSLMRTDRPSVSLLQKNPSSPVSCFATGFYPSRAEMFWRKDGEEIHDGVDKGEILPNNDGTFQMNVDIDLSSVPTEDRTKYECVFQLSGPLYISSPRYMSDNFFFSYFFCSQSLCMWTLSICPLFSSSCLFSTSRDSLIDHSASSSGADTLSHVPTPSVSCTGMQVC
uniref:Ig-like domain-containing protein n=1 Tax=Xiphophorus couchianus TaxID=32473 RepID=A0A3B5MCR3_9TELE